MKFRPRTILTAAAIAAAAAGTPAVLAAAPAGAATTQQASVVTVRPNPNPVMVSYYTHGQWVNLSVQAQLVGAHAPWYQKGIYSQIARDARTLAVQDSQLGQAVNSIRVPHPLLTQYLNSHKFTALAQQAHRMEQATRHNPGLKAQYQKVERLANQAAHTQNRIAFDLIRLGNRVTLR